MSRLARRRTWRAKTKPSIPQGWRPVSASLCLLSSVAGATFTAMLSGAWNPASADNVATDEHGDYLALHVLCQRAMKVTGAYFITQAGAAQAATNAQLAAPGRTTISMTGGRDKFEIETLGHVQLDAAEKDRAITDDFLAIQRDEQARIARQDARLRALLDLFAEPGMARLWWAERNPQLLIALKDGTFTDVLDHLPRRQTDEPGTYVEVLTRFLNSLDEDSKQLALRIFETVLTKWNADDLRSDLRRLRENTSSQRSSLNEQVARSGGK